MKKHEYKRLFQKVVGVNPTRSLKRKISYQALVAEEAFEAPECDSVIETSGFLAINTDL